MHQLKLQTKLFLVYVGLAILILLTFSIFFYKYVSAQLIEQKINSMNSQNSYFQEQVDAIINDMDTVSVNINYSSLVKDKLDSSFNLNISRNTLDSLASLFVTINGADIKVDQIYLYDLKGNILKVGMKTNTDVVDINSLSWFQEVLQLDGKKLISEPYKTSSLSTSVKYADWYLSVYRTYRNQYGRVVGAIETTKRCKSIFKSITSYKRTTLDPAGVYIYSSDNKLIYPYDITDEEKSSIPDYYSYVKSGEDKSLSLINPNTGAKEYLVYEASPYSGWKYISVQPETYILKPLYKLLQVLLIFVFILLAVSLLISFSLSRSLVKPIKHLKHIVQRLQIDTLGEDKVYNYPNTFNEVTELYVAFQSMSENLKVSMNELIDTRQQELKSRTLALQSQINPHLYYNTLSSIIVLAENGQPQEVITMCRYLSQIMRYITDSSATIIGIGLEIDYVNKYLYCMKVRYQSSLNYSVEVDEALLEYRVPKLIIQPIVENAIKYGTNCIPPWHLSITGHIYEDYWQIDIIDSGNGFSDKDIETINTRLEEVNRNPGMPEIEINGLGMINVYMRWKLFCGETMIFNYGNTEDGHGIVSIGQKLSKPTQEDEQE
jgi:two-component system, sensor histidine kinase YesM